MSQDGLFWQTYRATGITGCARKICAALAAFVPMKLLRRRTNRGVAAYFDLITDDGRLFYGDSFHFGFFHEGATTLADALHAHTDLVARMARLEKAKDILDIGCGIGAPAIRLKQTCAGHITGINISTEQVRQGRCLVAEHKLDQAIDLRVGNALDLDFPDDTFDAALAIEVAGDICVTEKQKSRLMSETHRILKPGGTMGFSDLVFTGQPTPAEEKVIRALFYHEGKELVTDWPAIIERQGFRIREIRDMIQHTFPTWTHTLNIYEGRREEVERRYGRKVAASTMEHLRCVPAIMQQYGSFPVISAEK